MRDSQVKVCVVVVVGVVGEVQEGVLSVSRVVVCQDVVLCRGGVVVNIRSVRVQMGSSDVLSSFEIFSFICALP